MGFFYPEQEITKTKTPTKQTHSVDEYHTLGCAACPLNTAPLRSPKMPATGSNTPLVYVIAEAPGEDEDFLGVQLIGPAGQVFREFINPEQLAVTRLQNTINCRPPNNRTPTDVEIECCRPRLIKDIETTKPKVILGLGGVSLKWTVGEVDVGITAWRGREIPIKVGSHTCWFIPTFHPSYLLRLRRSNWSGEVRKSEFESSVARDIKRAYALARSQSVPFIESLDNATAGIEIFTGVGKERELERLQVRLNELKQETDVAFDYETKGLKPYFNDSKILSVAIGTFQKVAAIALHHSQQMWGPLLPKVEELIIDFILNSRTKYAHSLNFELSWTGYFYGVRLLRCNWGDTLSQGYVLDERKGLLSADDLTLQYFGFRLKSISEGAKHVKDLDNRPIDEVLLYNGLDTKWEHLLALHQQARIEESGLVPIYNDQLRRIPTEVLSQLLGLNVDQTRVEKILNELISREQAVLISISMLPIVKQFEQENVKFNPSSNKDMALMFSKFLGYDEVARADRKTGFSTDASTLEKIDHPLAKLILELREIEKLKGTYVKPLLLSAPQAERIICDDGRLHTIYNSCVTETGRLSSTDPNIQNFPHRDNAYIREQVIAPRSEDEFLPKWFHF